MPRFLRNAAILAKIETTYGTDAAPAGATDALLVSNMSIEQYNANNVSRDLIRPYFGSSEQLAGAANVAVSFDVELTGSGTAGTAPAWGKILQACGMTETVAAGVSVDYLPNTAGVGTKSLTIYYHLDGVLHKLLGARGTVSGKMGVGERPLMSFKFTGLDGGVSATANPGVTLTAWKTPLVITDPNSGDLTLGCTYSAGALVAGTAFPSLGLEWDLGNTVAHIPLLGGESVDITQREAKGKIVLDLTAAQHVTKITEVAANTTVGLGIVHGTTAGNKVLLFAPKAQLINPSYEDREGRALVAFDCMFTPNSGNDELRIVAI